MRLAVSLRPLVLGAVLLVTLPPLCHAQWHVNGVALCTASGDQQQLRIASDGAGGAIVVWKDRRNNVPDIYAQRVSAAGVPQWTTDGVLVSPSGSGSDLPVIVDDGSGGAIITWKDHRGLTYDIYAQRLNALGQPQWTAGGVAVCNFTGEHEDPAITTDGANGAIIAWTDYRSGPSNSDIYAQRMSAAGGAMWMAQGVPVCTAAGSQFAVQICSVPAGGAIATWIDRRGGSFDDIYTQRLVAASGGTLWTANGVAMCAASGEQEYPQIVSDGSGGAVIAWEDLRGASADVYAQHAEDTGGASWSPADGVLVCGAAENQTLVQATTDGAAGAIMTWLDSRNVQTSDSDIYAQRIRFNGTVDPGWTADGTLICNAVSVQEVPVLAPDGVGGAILAWEDIRNANSTRFDIFAQRVRAAGTVDPAWTPNGQAVCTAAGDQRNPQIVEDGGGGAIIVWEDGRAGGIDVYAGRVTSGGTVLGVAPSGPQRALRLSVRPNPSARAVRIEWELGTPSRVTAIVYDLSGRRVRSLVSAREDGSGRQGVTWDGLDEAGAKARAGVYIVDVQTGGATASRRIALLR